MSFFERILGGKSKHLDHAVFGKILLFKTKNGSYWEAEVVREGEPFSVSIETDGEALPSDSQIEFYQRIAGDPDAAFASAAPLLIPEYEKWVGQSFPREWRSAFKFVGLAVPLEGLPTNPWDLSFDCLTDPAGHLFTCYFEQGVASYVTIDG